MSRTLRSNNSEFRKEQIGLNTSVERPAFSNPPLNEAADGRYGPITFRGSRSSWTKSKQHQSLGYRHTFACEMLMAGVSLTIVAKLLGHASEAITERHYGA